MIWHRVFATLEEPQETSLGKWPGDDFLGVALPDPSALRRRLVVRYQDKECYCECVDVGPWCTDDPYWLSGDVPRAQRYKSQPCQRSLKDDSLATIPDGKGGWLPVSKSNGAAIDLFPATATALGITDNVWVEWRFV